MRISGAVPMRPNASSLRFRLTPLALALGLAWAGQANAVCTQPGLCDLGTLGGDYSWAFGVSADGAVVVGQYYIISNAAYRAYRWTQGGGMVDLGTLGGSDSRAYGVSADGAVVVGQSYIAGNAAGHAFRWTQGGGMVDLGTLGGDYSWAWGVSADGAVVVGGSETLGNAATHAFRWTQGGGMVDLGTLGGSDSRAYGVSADGAVVVGRAYTLTAEHAFRWTQGGGMVDLGTLGGSLSAAYGVSADGSVVVGGSHTPGNTAYRAFRWTQGTGMQSVEDWLRAHGVNVPADITFAAYAVSADGRVIVGALENGRAFWASPTGLITPEDLQESLASVSQAGISMIRSGALLINGAHSRPLMRRVAVGKSAFWAAGDWGRDDHGAREGTVGLAEVGFGRNFGPVQLNASLGQTWAKQDLILGGRAKSEGTYLLAQALMPIGGALWGVVDGFYHWGDGDIRRGYINAGAPDASTGAPGIDTWGLRARLQWEDALQAGGMRFSPYTDLSYSEAKMDAYTESGGGLPAQFASRKDKATELRLGIEGRRALGDSAQFIATLEAAQRFEKNGGNISGEVIGLFPFDLKGPKNERSWLKVGAGVEGRIGGGTGHLMVNATTKGEVPNLWLAAGWRMAF